MGMSEFIDWIEDPTKVRQRITKVKEANRPSIQEGATYLALYYNRPASALASTDGGAIIGFDGLKDLGFNVLASAIRAGKSQIVQPLQPRVTPIGGTHQTKRACEALSQVIDGVFDLCDFTGIMESLVIDGALCGEGYGIIDVDPITKDFTAARLDPLESFYSSDRTEFYTTRVVSRRKLLAQYGDKPEIAAVIKNLPKYTPEHLVEVDAGGQWDAEDNVALYCAWAEKLGNLKGWHTIQLGDAEGTLLVNAEWEGPLPVFSFKWDHGHRGHDAKPLGRTIAPMHYWINEMVRKMNDALKGSVPVVIGDEDPKWSDVPYQFIPKGTGATIVVPTTVSKDVRQQIVDLKEEVHQETGTSEEAAAGAAPPQFKSGVALSTWRKIINEALGQQHRSYGRSHSQGARIICSRAPKVYSTKKARAAARGTDIIQQIDFSKINLPEDTYSVGFENVTDLPKHIPHQLELMAFAEEKGWIDGDEVLSHVTIVDFKAAAKRRSGPRALIELQISKALDEGELIPPSEVQDAAKLAELAGQALQAAQAQFIKPPREHMQALLHLYLLAKARVPGGAPAAPVPAAPGPGLTPEVAPPLATGTVAPPAEPLPIV